MNSKIIKKELIRKSIHISFISIAIFLQYNSNTYNRLIESILALIGIAYYVLEHLRLKNIQVPILSQIEQLALRESEKSKFDYAPLTLLLGIMLAIELYNNTVAIAAVIAVSVGDACATLAGISISKPKLIYWNKKKTYIGMLANIISVFLTCLLFFKTWRISFITAISSGLVETLDFEHIDNLIIPLFVGAVLYLTIF